MVAHHVMFARCPAAAFDQRPEHQERLPSGRYWIRRPPKIRVNHRTGQSLPRLRTNLRTNSTPKRANCWQSGRHWTPQSVTHCSGMHASSHRDYRDRSSRSKIPRQRSLPRKHTADKLADRARKRVFNDYFDHDQLIAANDPSSVPTSTFCQRVDVLNLHVGESCSEDTFVSLSRINKR